MLEWLKLDSRTHICLESVSPGECHEPIWPHPFLYIKETKMVLLPQKMELDAQTHIYLESVSPGECHKHIYMATPFTVFKKKPKMVLLPEELMEQQA